jgi:hypothetical protein
MNIPDPGILDLNFFFIPDPGFRRQKSTGSRIWIRNTRIPVPVWEIRRAHFLRAHDMTEISGVGLATVPVGVPRRLRRWGGENRLFCR